MLAANASQKIDLETIVELLFSLFSQRRRAGNYSTSPHDESAHAHNGQLNAHNWQQNTQNGESKAQNGQPYAQNWQLNTQNWQSNAQNGPSPVQARTQAEDPFHQDVLRWLDELQPQAAQNSARKNSHLKAQAQIEEKTSEAAVKYAQPPATFYKKGEYSSNNLISSLGGAQPHQQPSGDYRNRQPDLRENALAVELQQAIEALYTKLSASSPAIQRERRQDRLDVVPQGRQISDGLYSLDLKVGWESWAKYSDTTLMRVNTTEGVRTIEVDSSSKVAKAYRALDDKGLVGLFEKSDSGEIRLKEVLGLESASLNVAESAGQGISITYTQNERRVSDFEYLNKEMVLDTNSRNHGYEFINPVTVSEQRALDSSARKLLVRDEMGRAEEYEVRNNSAIAIMADAMLEQGYTPEIRKMDVLSNDGSRVESGIYIKNAYRTNAFGQRQALIKDTGHGGIWVELSAGSTKSEFVDQAGCSLNLERATPKAGQMIEARLGIVGRYDNRLPG